MEKALKVVHGGGVRGRTSDGLEAWKCVMYRARLQVGPRFGDICSCCCLVLLLPGNAAAFTQHGVHLVAEPCNGSIQTGQLNADFLLVCLCVRLTATADGRTTAPSMIGKMSGFSDSPLPSHGKNYQHYQFPQRLGAKSGAN